MGVIIAATCATSTSGVITTTSNASGGFALTLAPGAYTITASRPHFLPDALAAVVVTRSQVITLPNTTLRAGDADGDGAVGVGDLALVGANFGKAKDFAPAADLNGDGVMNILDLVLVAGNLGKSGTQPW